MLNRLISWKFFKRHNFSFKHNLQTPHLGRQLTTNFIFHVIEGVSSSSFNSKELSKYICKLKDEVEAPSMTWNVMSIVNCFLRGDVCRLFLTEKLWLLKHFNDVNLLNKKSEFTSKSRHENKLLIKSAEKGYYAFALQVL